MQPAVCALMPNHCTSRQLGVLPLPRVTHTGNPGIRTTRHLFHRNVKRGFRISPPADPLHSADKDVLPLQAQQLFSIDATAEQEELVILQQHSAQQQLPPDCPAPQQTPPATQMHQLHPHQPLKYAQLGHSRFSRGAPHVCYWHLGGSGIFYVKPEWDELVTAWLTWLQEQQEQWQHKDGQAGLGNQQITGILSNNSSSGSEVQQQHQGGLLGWIRSSSMLSALAAAAAAVAALPAAAAAATAGYLTNVMMPQDNWGNRLLRVLSVATVTSVMFLAAVELGRRMVGFMLLCYSGLLLT